MNYTEFMARVEDKLQESSGFPVAGMSVQEMERLCLEIGHRRFGGSLYSVSYTHLFLQTV